MHAADAIHGDLGLIQKNDIVICISKSGNTPEIKALIPFIKSSNSNKLIAITGDIDSFLALNADFILNSKVEKEACPNNLAPTTSTTAQLVIGDALAVTLLKLRGFGSKDFAKYHPGGSLGKKLYLKVEDIINTQEKPEININSNISNVIVEMSEKMLGAVVVLDDKNDIKGIITDGDLRRQLVKSLDIAMVKAKEIMTKEPFVINSNLMAVEALKIMKSKKISHLIVEKNNKYYGVIHIQNIIKEGKDLMDKNNYNLWGMYPVPNYYFMKNEISTNLKFCIGRVFGFNNTKDVICNDDCRDDYERSILYYDRDGGIIRFNHYVCDADTYIGKGGLAESRTIEKMKKSCDYLLQKYPQYVRPKTCKSQYPEIRLVSNTNGKNI